MSKYVAFLETKKQKNQLLELVKKENLSIQPRHKVLDFVFDIDNVNSETTKITEIPGVYPEPEPWLDSKTYDSDVLMMIARYGGCNLIAEIMTGIFNKPAYMVYHEYPYYDNASIFVDDAKEEDEEHDWQKENYSQPIQHAYFVDDKDNIVDLFNTFNDSELSESPLYDAPDEYDDYDPIEVITVSHDQWQNLNKYPEKYALNQWTDLVNSGLAIQIIDHVINVLAKTKPWLQNGEFKD